MYLKLPYREISGRCVSLSTSKVTPGGRTELRAGHFDLNVRGNNTDGAQGREGNQTVHPTDNKFTPIS